MHINTLEPHKAICYFGEKIWNKIEYYSSTFMAPEDKSIKQFLTLVPFPVGVNFPT